ncbi:MAG: AgmX/PglI C-terminal domain-containing protein [Myxococcales bacterium]|nr:AgmX/PglI C-terminal domain-containing protein [Myxococcales bacterium]
MFPSLMSHRIFPLVAVTLALAACGGAAPQAKTESQASSPPPASGAPEEAQAKDQDKDGKGTDGKGTAPGADSSGTSAATDEAKPKPPAASNGELAAPPADDPWMAPHQMPPADVLKTMRAAMNKVNACYRSAKKRDGSVTGDVKVKFVITHEGAVRVWRDEGSSMSDPDCTKCVGEVIQTLKFPTQKSPGDAWGLYSINFGG